MGRELTSVKEGNLSLVPDPNFVRGESDGGAATPMVPSKSVNPEWFQGMQQTENVSVDDLRKIVDKAINGKRLGKRQTRIVGILLNELQAQKIELHSQQVQDRLARRKGELETGPVAPAEQVDVAEVPGIDPRSNAVAAVAADAITKGVDQATVQSILDSNKDSVSTIAALYGAVDARLRSLNSEEGRESDFEAAFQEDSFESTTLSDEEIDAFFAGPTSTEVGQPALPVGDIAEPAQTAADVAGFNQTPEQRTRRNQQAMARAVRMGVAPEGMQEALEKYGLPYTREGSEEGNGVGFKKAGEGKWTASLPDGTETQPHDNAEDIAKELSTLRDQGQVTMPLEATDSQKQLSEITITETVEVEGTGEVVEISRPADQLVRQLDKRLDSAYKLMDCL